VREAVEGGGFPILSAEITMLPKLTAKLDDPEDVKKMNKILDLLEEDDDVQDVYHNWEIDE